MTKNRESWRKGTRTDNWGYIREKNVRSRAKIKEKVEREIEEKTAQLNQQNNHIDDLQNKSSIFIEALKEKDSEIENLTKTCSEMQNTISSKDNEADKNCSQINQMKNSIADLQTQIGTMKGHLDQVTSSNNSLEDIRCLVAWLILLSYLNTWRLCSNI